MSAEEPITLDLVQDENTTTETPVKKKKKKKKKKDKKEKKKKKKKKQCDDDEMEDHYCEEDDRIYEHVTEVNLMSRLPDRVLNQATNTAGERAGAPWGVVFETKTVPKGRNEVKPIVTSVQMSDEEDSEDHFPTIYSIPKNDHLGQPLSPSKSVHAPVVTSVSTNHKRYYSTNSLQVGDILFNLFGGPFSSIEQLYNILENIHSVKLTVRRSGTYKETMNQLAKYDAPKNDLQKESMLLTFENKRSKKRCIDDTALLKEQCADDNTERKKSRKNKVEREVERSNMRENSLVNISKKKKKKKEKKKEIKVLLKESSKDLRQSKKNSGSASPKAGFNDFHLPDDWTFHNNVYIHKETNFCVKESQHYIMSDLIRMLSNASCKVSPKRAYKQCLKNHEAQRKSEKSKDLLTANVTDSQITQSPTDRSFANNQETLETNTPTMTKPLDFLPTNQSGDVTTKHVHTRDTPSSTTEFSHMLSDNPNLYDVKESKNRPRLRNLRQSELVGSWLCKNNIYQPGYYIHGPTGISTSSNYEMKIVVDLLRKNPNLDVVDALCEARKQNKVERALYKSQSASGEKAKIVAASGWRESRSKSGRIFFLHESSGLVVYSKRALTRILELIEEGYPVVEAKRIDRREQENKSREKKEVVLPDGWKESKSRVGKKVFVHEVSGQKIFSMRQMTRVLELMEEGYSIAEAKRIDSKEQKKQKRN